MNNKGPFFSIIIPTYNRPKQLGLCLGALSELNYPRDRFEVIVVDDGSMVSPEGVISSFNNTLCIRFISQKNAGCSVARNKGAALAKGDFLAFTDDDCLPAPDWLRNMAESLARSPDAAVCGQKLSAPPYNLYTTVSQLFWDYLYAFYNGDPDHADLMDSANMALHRECFRILGGFNEELLMKEDRELCDWLQYNGVRTVYAPKVLVYHSHRYTFRAFWQQHLTYGRTSFHFRTSKIKRGRNRKRLEPFPFYLNLLYYPFTRSFGLKAYLYSGLLLISQIATTAGFLHEWAIHRRKRN